MHKKLQAYFKQSCNFVNSLSILKRKV